jgi:hypothetical protein
VSPACTCSRNAAMNPLDADAFATPPLADNLTPTGIYTDKCALRAAQATYRNEVRFLKPGTELLQINPARYSINRER